MSETSKDRLLQLLARALELPAAARKAFLDSKCGGDPELRLQLEGMLAAAAGQAAVPQPAPTADARPVTSAAPAATAPLREGPGTTIGPYRLLQQIGEGGFGAVFLAEQTEPVARRVALKIVKLGMDTHQVVARFEQERQALALMDHPNIARVIDAGATATGRPFFVMDHVKGAPIAEYCDQNHLTIEERLDLFVQVCSAVQHAHGKGIIHRDLKPSNVLVGTQDGKPLAKVIDFGIAKATSQKLTDKTLFTAQEQVIGTLQYMSPEQAEGSLDIDTRTDVYSLGVMLYELLVGSSPFAADALPDGNHTHLQRLVCEVDPPKPSTRLDASRATLASIAAHRRIEPKRLGLLLRGELDWIVMKALEKDRQRRYETANGLANDIRRYRAGEPVTAAPPSTAYRLRKLVQRHRGVFAAGCAVGVALLGGVVAFAWQARVAQHERDAAVAAQRSEAEQRQIADQQRQMAVDQRRVAEEQRGLAERSQDQAKAINQFLLDMLGAADIRKLGRDAKVAQALDAAATTVQQAFAHRPEVEPEVRLILGRTYLSLGMLDAATPQIEAALQTNRRLHGETSQPYAMALRAQAALKQARGDNAAAARLFEQAGDLLATSNGVEDRVVLAVRTDYANCLVQLGRDAEAETLLRRLLVVRRRVFGDDDNDTQIGINSLAVVLHRLGQLDEAEGLYREAVAAGERRFGAQHPDTLTARLNLASMLHSRGDAAAAEAMMVPLLADLRRVFGAEHGKTASACRTLGDLYKDLGRFRDAAPLLQESVTILTRAEGPDSLAAAEAKGSLAIVSKRLGDVARAVQLQREVVSAYATRFGDRHERTLNARLNLANSLVAPNEGAAAEAIFGEVLGVSEASLGASSSVHIIANNSYGVFLMARDRYADAEPYVRRALDLGAEAEGEEHQNTVITRYNLACIELELGKLAEAEELHRACVAAFARVFGAQHPNTATAHGGLGRALAKLGRTDEARAEFEAAIGICKAALGAQNQGFCDHALELGRLLGETGNAAAAEPVLQEAADVYTKARGLGDRRTANTRLELGHCLGLLGRFAEAEPLLLESLATLEQTRPEGHRDRRRAVRHLAAFYAAWQAAAPDPARAAKAAEWQGRSTGLR
jgi:serine/threonine protein kinase/tetratricopeptide (TPR) repeat protein